MDAITAMLFFVLGAIFGSFANVLIYRMPKKIPFAKGRSACTSCKEALGIVDLIPIISYCALRGKCRHCGARFSVSYLFIEILVALLFLGAYLRFGLYSSVFVVFILFVLVVLAIIDFHTLEIYDSLVAMLFGCGLFWVVLHHFFSDVFLYAPDWRSSIVGFFVGGFLLVLFNKLCLLFIKKEGFGFGDVKLMFAAGVFLGWQHTIVAFFLAFIIGGFVSGIGLLGGRVQRGDYVAFGPYLAIGTMLALFFGTHILGLYVKST